MTLPGNSQSYNNKAVLNYKYTINIINWTNLSNLFYIYFENVVEDIEKISKHV